MYSLSFAMLTRSGWMAHRFQVWVLILAAASGAQVLALGWNLWNKAYDNKKKTISKPSCVRNYKDQCKIMIIPSRADFKNQNLKFELY